MEKMIFWVYFVFACRLRTFADLVAQSGDESIAKYDWENKGVYQSPVDLQTSSCVIARLPALEWGDHWSPRDKGFTLVNTLHSVEVRYPEDSVPTIRGGPLNEAYVLAQVHFHWGEADTGTEHTFDGERYAMEAHLVHYRSSYGSFAEAAKHFDGLAVIGILFKVCDEDNPALASLISALSRVATAGSTSTLEGDAMGWLEASACSQRFFYYKGSLTTPPYSEIVNWIVMKKIQTIGPSQLEQFKIIEGHQGIIAQNARPPQPMHGRCVILNKAHALRSIELEVDSDSN